MKKIVPLALVLALLLCGCGGKAPETPAATQAVQTTASEAAETAEPAVYAESMFAVEDIVYEMRRGELKNFEVKIRNITDKRIDKYNFRVQALDDRGDVLEAWSMGASDALDAGQAIWFYCHNSIFDDCKNMEEAAQRAETLRITYASVQTVKDDPKTWVEYDFENPPTYAVADIQPKEG